MRDGELLLEPILEKPDEDTPRLVYADWLQENGQHKRAEFIRVQCEYAVLHRHFEDHQADGENLRCLRCVRAGVLSDLLLGKFRLQPQAPAPFAADCPHRIARMADYRGEPVEWDWYRGFVREVRCPADWWLAHGDAIRAAHPVTAVRLQTAFEWDGDEDGAWLVRDPQGRRVAWVDVRAAATAAERDSDDLFPAFLRLRWPGVAFELPR